MKFYHYYQNNSGGVFDTLEGGFYNLLVEAENADEANKIAQEHGVYFNGCADGSDCECCGDRWYPCDERDGFDSSDPCLADYNSSLIIRKAS